MPDYFSFFKATVVLICDKAKQAFRYFKKFDCFSAATTYFTYLKTTYEIEDINRGDYGLARVHLVCEAISEGNLLLLLPHLSDGAELEVHPVPQPVQLVLFHLPPPASEETHVQTRDQTGTGNIWGI